MGATFGQYGPYELEPFTIWERMNIERKVVTVPQGSGNNQSLPYLWYEYWPKELMNGAPERSVPVMVLLHGNANDPRTRLRLPDFLRWPARSASSWSRWSGRAAVPPPRWGTTVLNP